MPRLNHASNPDNHPTVRVRAHSKDAQSGRGSPIAKTEPTCTASSSTERPHELRTPSLIASSRAYVDTFAMFFPDGQPKGMYRELRFLPFGKLWFKPCRIGIRLFIQQPSKQILQAVAPWQTANRGVSSILHISYEFEPVDLSRGALSDFIRRSTILRRRCAGPMWDEETTLYWSQENRKAAPLERNATFYDDLQSKLTGLPQQPKLELRFQNAAGTQKAVRLVNELVSLNPRQLFDRHFKIVDFDRHVQREALDAHKNGTTPERVRGAYQRLGGRVQLYKDQYPNVVARLRSINNCISIPDRLEWGATPRNDHKDKIFRSEEGSTF